MIRHHLPSLMTTAAFGAAALLAFLLVLYADMSGLKHRIDLLDQAAVSEFRSLFPETKTIVDPFMQMQVAVKQAREDLQISQGRDGNGSGSAQKTIDILTELSKTIPENVDVVMSRFLYNADRILLSGTTDTFNTVDRVKGLIERTELFSRVTINSAAADKTGQRIRFQFVIEF